MNLPPIHFLEAFEAVARRKNITQAAHELHVTPSAISHRIANLEIRLGVQLFHRNTKSVELTEDGYQYLMAIQISLEQITTATHDIGKNIHPAVIKLDCCQSFATLWLLPRIKSFMQHFPGILLQFTSAKSQNKNEHTHCDIQIARVTKGPGHLVVENLFKEHIAPLASQEFMKNKKIKEHMDLCHEPLIYSTSQRTWWSVWFKKNGLVIPNLLNMFGFTQSYLSLEAAHQGLGVVIESRELAEDYLDKAYIQPIFNTTDYLEMPGYHLAYSENAMDVQHIAQFRAWLFGEVGHKISDQSF